jgi:hypothetical protein
MRSSSLDQGELENESGTLQYASNYVDARDVSDPFAETQQFGSPNFGTGNTPCMPQAGNDGRYDTSYGASYFPSTPQNRLRGSDVANTQNRDYDTVNDRSPFSTDGARGGANDN